MRRILLDEGVPVGVRPHLQGFSVDTAAEVGWAGLVNGALIAAAEQAGYEIMVTCDQNIRYQQNLAKRQIALVVLETNNWVTIRAAVGTVTAAVNSAQPGSYVSIAFERPPLRRRPRPMSPSI
jgi:hypothetical protein